MGCNVCRYNKENYEEIEFKNIYNNKENNEKEKNEEIKQIKKKSENNIKLKNINNDNININHNNEDKKENVLNDAPNIKNSQENKIESKINKQSSISSTSPPIIKNSSNKDQNIEDINNNKESPKPQINKIIIKNEFINTNIIINNSENNNNTINNSKLHLLKDFNKEEQKENNNNISQSVSSFQKNDYITRILDLINKIRKNPKEYSKTILENIQYIRNKVKILVDEDTGKNEEIVEIFFQKKVKVELYEGEIAFIKTANFLKKLKPMNELIYNDDIKINIPDDILFTDDKRNIIKQLNNMKKNYNISAFFKDKVKNPEIGLMLMIIGDYKNSENKKRNAILNPKNKFIGINYKFIKDSFVSYFTFSK